MNIDNNKLFLETEQRILKAYRSLIIQKEMKKITVRDICLEAQIHRTTFYRHFQDLPDLQNRMDQLHLEEIFRDFINQDRWNLHDGIIKQLQLLYDNRTIILRNLSSADLQKRLQTFISGNLINEYTDSYMEKYNCESHNEVLYHRDFFSAGFAALISRWLENGCKESPELICKYICKIFDL